MMIYCCRSIILLLDYIMFSLGFFPPEMILYAFDIEGTLALHCYGSYSPFSTLHSTSYSHNHTLGKSILTMTLPVSWM